MTAGAPPAAALPVIALPGSVHVREVGPRDGFQNEPESIPTKEKIRLIDALARAGCRRIEVASFVRPDVIPQLADADEVLDGIDVPDHVRLMVLVPNSRGLDNALRHRERIHDVALFVSASETHNRRNVNRAVADTMRENVELVGRVREAGLDAAAVVATAFGCPFEGRVPMERTLDLAAELIEAGVSEMGFGDTTGMCNPAYARAFFTEAVRRFPDVEITAHFHNTRGQGLANAYAALEAGCTSFESSFGELGGCPVPVGSTGNIATEDLVSMLHEMGVDTGIDLDALIGAARDVQDVLGRRLTSHSIIAGPVRWDHLTPGT